MYRFKKWLNIAIVFILTLSLISPAAFAEEQVIVPNEFETMLDSENINPANPDVSQLSNGEITSNDSAQINSKTRNLDEAIGEVTISVEKFTLGQGYAIEPIQVPIYAEDMVGHVIARLLGNGNYNDGTSDENIVYLANIRDSAR